VATSLAVGVDAVHAFIGRRHVEHHDVVGVSCNDALEVAGVHRRRPTLDQPLDLFVVRHPTLSHVVIGFLPDQDRA
jgi:hypothetical protein